MVDLKDGGYNDGYSECFDGYEVVDVGVEDLELFFGKAIKETNLSDEDKSRILDSLKDAIIKQENKTKKLTGVKVRRLPKIENDASEAAHMMGMDELAKELTVERPKPIVTDIEKNEVTGVTRHMRVISKSEIERLEKEMSKKEGVEVAEGIGGFEMLVNDVAKICENYKSDLPSKEGKNIFSTVEALEEMVGQCTKDKLVAERRLRMAKLALEEAYAKLNESSVNDIMETFDTKPKDFKIENEDFKQAFEGRRY